MLASWAIFYFAKDISHIYIALCLSGISGGLLEAPVSLTIALSTFAFRIACKTCKQSMKSNHRKTALVSHDYLDFLILLIR